MPLLLAPDEPGVRRAAEILRAGGLVAFPTETVYGLGARADDEAAVARIYAAKGRPAHNPSIVHVASVEAARAVAALGPTEEALAAAFWPGPLTLVAPRRPGAVADAVTAGGETVALRVPDHPVALALLRAVGVPVAAPSANRSTHVSPTQASHVARSLGDAVDAILDAGPSSRGIESTIVDARGAAEVVLLRHGALSSLDVAGAIAPRPLVDRAARHDPAGEVAPAPGGQARHYAPRGALFVAPRGELAARVADARAAAARTVGLVTAGALSPLEGAAGAISIELPADVAGFARGLYAALHALEERGCDAIVVERPPEGAGWAAVRDRLRRASVPAGS